MKEQIKQEALLSDKAIESAFDGAFDTPINFDHKPTPEEIMLIRFRAIAQAQLDEVWGIAKKEGKRELVSWLHEMVNCEHLFYSHSRFTCEQCGCVEALKDE